MTAYNVAASESGVHGKQLAANTADSVTFANDVKFVDVGSDGSAPIYFTVDGSTPTVGGQNTYAVPQAGRAHRRIFSIQPGDVVKLISAGTPTYSVTGFNEGSDELIYGPAGAPAPAPTTQTSVAATNASADVLAANAAATYRLIVNAGADSVTLKLGSGSVTDYQGVFLAPGSVWDGWIGNRFYNGLVRGKCLTSTATLAVLEG